MTAFVTGATGFIGAAVVRRLLDRGEQVRALVRPGSDRRNLEGLNVDLFEGELCAGDAVCRGLEGCDSVFHLAADYRLWMRNPDAMYKTNIDGSSRLVRCAASAGVSRVVYTSSVATLGHTNDGSPADEKTPSALSDMIGHYKRSKFLAEQAVLGEGVAVVVVNPSTPVGPGDVKPTPTGRVIVEAGSGNMPAFVDTGLNIAHVDDVAEGHVLARDNGKPGERYVLGGTDMTLQELLVSIAQLLGRRPPRFKLPRWAVYPVAVAAEARARLTGSGEPFVTTEGLKMARQHMFFSSAKAKKELGYRFRPASEAISDAVTWFRRHGYIGD